MTLTVQMQMTAERALSTGCPGRIARALLAGAALWTLPGAGYDAPATWLVRSLFVSVPHPDRLARERPALPPTLAATGGRRAPAGNFSALPGFGGVVAAVLSLTRQTGRRTVAGSAT